MTYHIMAAFHELPFDYAAHLLAWYDVHRRELPWRSPPGVKSDPYRVWLSEIMLQQTTTTAVAPYYRKFLHLWPNVGALADAPVAELMQAWAGLGYYSRARNLHACAKTIAARQGQFPPGEDDLRQLPGIGPYTAAAIAAIAFDRRAVVVDGNVERVVARLFAIETPLPAARTQIKACTDTLTPEARCGDFAQAMMDLGAMICQPKRPNCLICPFLPVCRAAQRGDAAGFPRRTAKAARPERQGAVFFIERDDGAVLVRTRPPNGLLGGMTELPTNDWASNWTSDWANDLSGTAMTRAAPLAASFQRHPEPVRHVFTHFSLTLHVFSTRIIGAEPPPAGYRWAAAADMNREAWPSVMRKVLNRMQPE